MGSVELSDKSDHKTVLNHVHDFKETMIVQFVTMCICAFPCVKTTLQVKTTDKYRFTLIHYFCLPENEYPHD